jgi:transposase InsO family protein
LGPKEVAEMPFRERSIMDQKAEFVRLAEQEGCSFRALCERFGISRPTGYKWLARARAEGEAGLAERSRRPRSSPARSADAVEAAVIAVRREHPTWGGWKIHHRLLADGEADAPSPSTCTAILRRRGLIAPDPAGPRALARFEAPAPNALWQVDFKGHVAAGAARCHPLTVLDDHSRYLIGLVACADEREGTVREALTALFRRYGLPERILTDNGSPWGSAHDAHPWSALSMWFFRLGIDVSHGRPFHPQTQGKVERFHGTLKADLLATRAFPDLAAAQAAFDDFRADYNARRPHQALRGAVPATPYRASPRPFPEPLPPLEYAPDDRVRAVGGSGQISLGGRSYFISHVLRGERIALRATEADGVLEVRYAHVRLGRLDRRTGAFTPAPSTRGPHPV